MKLCIKTPPNIICFAETFGLLAQVLRKLVPPFKARLITDERVTSVREIEIKWFGQVFSEPA